MKKFKWLFTTLLLPTVAIVPFISSCHHDTKQVFNLQPYLNNLRFNHNNTVIANREKLINNHQPLTTDFLISSFYWDSDSDLLIFINMNLFGSTILPKVNQTEFIGVKNTLPVISLELHNFITYLYNYNIQENLYNKYRVKINIIPNITYFSQNNSPVYLSNYYYGDQTIISKIFFIDKKPRIDIDFSIFKDCIAALYRQNNSLGMYNEI